MKYIKQFSIILFISFIGEMAHHFIKLPIPASIYGIVIMFLCLLTKIVKLESVKETGDFLVKIMPLTFIPAAVGLLNVWDIIKVSLLEYILVTILSTILVMVVSGHISQLIIRHTDKKISIKNNKIHVKEARRHE